MAKKRLHPVFDPTIQVAPVATPVDTFIQPAMQAPNSLLKGLADGLGSFVPVLKAKIDNDQSC